MKKNKPVILLLLALLVFSVTLSFLPSIKNDFTNLDDGDYLVNNPLVKDLSLEGIGRIFNPLEHIYGTSFNPQLYVPMVTLSYALEYHFFNFNPQAYHSTNLILHLLNVLLVFWMIYLLCGNIYIAFITALIFGIHPLRVESVAWVTERKDVLYAFFYLWAVVCYLYFKRNSSIILLLGTYILFTFSLLSKPVAVTLLFVLPLCDFYIDKKFTLRSLLNKIPIFIIAAVFALLSQIGTRYLLLDPDFNFFDYLLIPIYSLVFYIIKIVAPLGLTCLYPYPLKSNGLFPAEFYIYRFYWL